MPWPNTWTDATELATWPDTTTGVATWWLEETTKEMSSNLNITVTNPDLQIAINAIRKTICIASNSEWEGEKKKRTKEIIETIEKLEGNTKEEAKDYLLKHMIEKGFLWEGWHRMMIPWDRINIELSLILFLDENRQKKLLEDEKFKEELLEQYDAADRSTGNFDFTWGGDILIDNELGILSDSPEFHSRYKDILMTDILSGVDLQANLHFWSKANVLNMVIDRLSKKYIDQSFIEDKNVQSFLIELLKTVLNSGEITWNDYKPFAIIKDIIKLKEKGFIKNDYFESDDFIEWITQAFRKKIDKWMFVSFTNEEYRRRSIKDITRYLELNSQLINWDILKPILTDVIMTKVDGLFDHSDEEKMSHREQLIKDLHL